MSTPEGEYAEEEQRTSPTGGSDSSSDNSYVQVSREDVAQVTLLSDEHPEEFGIEVQEEEEEEEAEEEEEDIYGEAEKDEEPPEKPPLAAGSQGNGSPEFEWPPEDTTLRGDPEPSAPSEPPLPSAPSVGVEEVTPADVPSRRSPSLPATGYLTFLNKLHPVLLYIIYWRDLKLSGVVLGACLVVLLTLTLNTFLHTIVLLLISIMVVSLTYIVLKISADSFYNREIKNPFSDYLNRKITLPEDKILQWTEYVIQWMDIYFNHIIRLLLFDNIKASLKFGVALWLASFITNHLTVLCFLFWVVILAFSVPVAYERFQSKIDRHIDSTSVKVRDLASTVKGHIPYLGKPKVE